MTSEMLEAGALALLDFRDNDPETAVLAVLEAVFITLPLPPEMIRAGADALAEHHTDYESRETGAIRVWEAMLKAAGLLFEG